MSSRLLILSDRPELFERVKLPDRDVLRWRAELASGERRRVRRGWTDFGGEPTDAATFDELLGDDPDTVALIDIAETERAAGAARALAEASPEIGILALCTDDRPPIPRDLIARCVEWPDFLRVDLEHEVHRLETQRRVTRLRAFAQGARVLPVLVQAEPDPDAMASALAVRVLLRRQQDDTPIVTLGGVTRPENRRMVELLRLRITTVSEAELAAFERIVVVDMQPIMLHGVEPRIAVIDHHPVVGGYLAEFADIRPRYGATATMMTEYIRADDERRVRKRVATALLYGIKTDTASLSRGVTAADVTAYAFLQGRSDAELLHRIERPGFDLGTVRDFGRALEGMTLDGDLAIALMGAIPPENAHILANLGDFLIGMQGVRWAAAGGVVDDRLVLKLRHVGSRPGAGELATALARRGGTGGGHITMAQVILPLDAGTFEVGSPAEDATRRVLDMIRSALDEIRTAAASTRAEPAAVEG
ncbi:MAG: DHH family phosphoesterase [Longimicrobiales bacterium]